MGFFIQLQTISTSKIFAQLICITDSMKQRRAFHSVLFFLSYQAEQNHNEIALDLFHTLSILVMWQKILQLTEYIEDVLSGIYILN